MNKDFIAYQGKEYTVEWYFNENGKSKALDYFDKLDVDDQDRLFYLIQRLADTGSISNKEKFNYEGDHIFAFKPKPHRFFCFFYKDSKVIITNAYKKQSQKMSPTDKLIALNYKIDYEIRSKNGSYYDKKRK